MAVRSRHSRPAVLVVSTLAMGLGAAPTFLTGYLGPALRDDLDLSGAWLGLLVGLFYGATGLTSFGASRLIDRLGARRCVAGDQAVVAAALTAAAVTSSLPVLAVGSALAGSAYAFANAGTSVAVTAVTDRARAGTAVATKTAGIPGTAAVLALTGLPAAGLIGWQGVCLAMAGLAALNAVAAALVLPGAVPPAGAHRTPGGRLPRGFTWVALAAVFFVVGTNPLTSWLVLSLVDGGVPRAGAAAVAAAGSGAGAVAMVLVARRGDRSGPRRRAATAAVVAALTTTGILLLWAGTHVSLVLVTVGAVAGLVTAMVGAGFAHAVTVDRAPHAVGRATAVMSGGYYLGALVSPLAFGALADATGGYDVSWAVTAGCMALCAVSYAVVQHRVRPPSGQAASASSQDAPAESSFR